MSTLAPPSVPAPRPDRVDGLEPPTASQAAVPAAFASLTWPSELAVSELPAPTVDGDLSSPPFAPPSAPWASPTTQTVDVELVHPHQQAGSHRSGWDWTPIMGDDRQAQEDRSTPDVDLTMRLRTLDAVLEAAPIANTAVTDAANTPMSAADTAMPDVSFEAVARTFATEVTAVDTAVVTATVPAFVSSAPSADLVLPDVPAREPMSVEVREVVMNVPVQRRPAPRRSSRATAIVLVLAAAVSAAGYLGLREYIYGESNIASDGTRVVEVEPSRTIVVLDAP